LYILRGELEQYKAAIMGRLADPPQSDFDSLVPLKICCAELGVGRRTLGRRFAGHSPLAKGAV
jgi:hypothetical protein